EARLYGVARALSTRVLLGQGWTVAAMTRPGGLGAFISGSAADLTDQTVPLGQALGADDAALLAEVTAGPGEAGGRAGAGRGPAAQAPGRRGGRGSPAGRGGPGGAAARRPVRAGGNRPADPAAEGPAVRRR